MSSADSRPPESPNRESAAASGQDPSGSPTSPSLKGPPRRPVRAAAPPPPPSPELSEMPLPPKEGPAPVVEPPPEASQPPEPEAETEAQEAPRPRVQPIAPPSEPMQYRAIGLLRGKYVPSEESFNRGQILNHDGSETGAVLLGRATSLVRKHIDLDSEHLWVVYPRTIFQDNQGLAVQIVGVWEPETLREDDDDDQAQVTPVEELQPDYFSIRGEVSKYDEGKEEITISIVQKMRAGKQPKRPFKLLVRGNVEVKTIGYFWDLHVQREANQLVMTEGSCVAAVPPKKRSKRRPADGDASNRRPAKRAGAAPRPKPVKSKPAEMVAEPDHKASPEASPEAS